MVDLVLQWVDDPRRAFEEFRRVLTVGGLLTFTTFGPDTLKELARAFAGIDGYTHVSRFVDMHDLGDMLVQSGFADPVMDMEMLTVTYASPAALLAELKALGATNQTRGRPRGLTGSAAGKRSTRRSRRWRATAAFGDVRFVYGMRGRAAGRTRKAWRS